MQPALPARTRSARMILAALTLIAAQAQAGEISRLTPPSELFSSGQSEPVIARFLPGQLFDLQATVQPDPGTTITNFAFSVAGLSVTRRYTAEGLARTSIVTETGDAATCIADGKTTGKAGCTLVAGLPANTAVISQRGFSKGNPGVHDFEVVAEQSDGKLIRARGNFEVVGIDKNSGKVAKNIIIFLGDGMGAAHRTAARIMSKGYAQGKAKGLLDHGHVPADRHGDDRVAELDRDRLRARHAELRDRQQVQQQPGRRIPGRHARCVRQSARGIPVRVPAQPAGKVARRGHHRRRVRRDAGLDRRAHLRARQRHRHRRPVPRRPPSDRPQRADGRWPQVVPAQPLQQHQPAGRRTARSAARPTTTCCRTTSSPAGTPARAHSTPSAT